MGGALEQCFGSLRVGSKFLGFFCSEAFRAGLILGLGIWGHDIYEDMQGSMLASLILEHFVPVHCVCLDSSCGQ